MFCVSISLSVPRSVGLKVTFATCPTSLAFAFLLPRGSWMLRAPWTQVAASMGSSHGGRVEAGRELSRYQSQVEDPSVIPSHVRKTANQQWGEAS